MDSHLYHGANDADKHDGFVDPNVVEGVDEPVSTIPNSFASLVTNEVVTCKVNFRSLDSDKPINAKADVKISTASILDVHLRFGFSLYGYFMGKRVALPVVENYVKNAWKKFGLVRVMMNSKGFFFFKFASIEVLCVYSHGGRMDYACALIDIRADRELKEDMVIDIPNVEDGGEVLHTVRVEYEWKPPRCDVCMVFGRDDMLCPKRSVKKTKKQHTNHDGFQDTSSYHGTNVGSKLNTIAEGDELGSNGGSSNSGKKVVQDVAGSASGSPSNAHLVTRINELESQMIEGTLVLLDDDGKLLKPSKLTLLSSSNKVSKKVDYVVNKDNDSEVKEVYDETASYMASTGFNVNKASKSGSGGRNKSLYEQWKENHGEDPYDDDDFDDPGLTDA
ncbi:reverse transcriptase domain-containing protein [Tanacetum coccineum]